MLRFDGGGRGEGFPCDAAQCKIRTLPMVLWGVGGICGPALRRALLAQSLP